MHKTLWWLPIALRHISEPPSPHWQNSSHSTLLSVLPNCQVLSCLRPLARATFSAHSTSSLHSSPGYPLDLTLHISSSKRLHWPANLYPLPIIFSVLFSSVAFIILRIYIYTCVHCFNIFPSLDYEFQMMEIITVLLTKANINNYLLEVKEERKFYSPSNSFS